MEFYNSFLILMRNKTVKVARSCEIITIAYVPVDFLEEPLFIYLFPIVSRKGNFGKWELFFGVSFIAIRKKTTETTHIVCVCVCMYACVCAYMWFYVVFFLSTQSCYQRHLRQAGHFEENWKINSLNYLYFVTAG